ncbi:DUF2383 domain-containing protein [Bacillus infantis]|uniref:DUF2383 domain-containing protein n=1 Tax=Bacillus infantis TaxID=324767 RepID=A0A5D4RNJ6_9BACI|nr:DUF2383 domain-containing protein [Bacillus infantis]
MDNHSVAKELNKFLKGMYMGIHAYEHFIEKIADEGVRAEFQRMQQEHKQNAALDKTLTGEDYYAIQMSEENVRGDLDPESRRLVEKVLDTDRKHVEYLNTLKGKV